MTQKFESTYVSCGCNKIPHAADWGANNLICFASCNSIAIYDPTFAGEGGKIIHTLQCHKERVNCVRWLRNNLQTPENKFLSTSADATVAIWYWCDKSYTYRKKFIVGGHANVVNIADGFLRKEYNLLHIPIEKSLVVATASIDSTVRVWEAVNENNEIECVDVIKWNSGFCLDVKLGIFPKTDILLLACAADDNKIHLFAEHKKSEIDQVTPDHRFYKIHVLHGHSDWVRSIDFLLKENDLYLASGSQDSYIRIYKFERRNETKKIQNTPNNIENTKDILELEEKILKIGTMFDPYYFAVTLETVLTGHEGWVYSVSWMPTPCSMSNEIASDQTTEITGMLQSSSTKLLSASMDKSLIIWSPDQSGLWSEETRVGEVGGNLLGFYGGKFGPTGKSIMGHGYQGSFHIWSYDDTKENWEPKVVVGGHTSEVMDLAWDIKGNYILSVGKDQTTRLHAPWVRNNGTKITWHEIARPQLHGYDMSCIAILSENKFTSGAEEKVIRAFAAPNNFVENFKRICNIKDELGELTTEGIPQGASVPALGLSNKPVFDQMKKDGFLVDDEYPDLYFSPIHLEKPPTEENLSQNTLWPEIHKIYGHGYEIYSLAAKSDGSVLASACKATNPEHAAIILWNPKTWLQIQKLIAHQLTVTQMSFSPNGEYLLSVSRDRKWCLFGNKKDDKRYELLATSNSKNNLHTRVIWCCAWTPDSLFFSTGSRDGKIGFWTPAESDLEGEKMTVASVTSLELPSESVTALAFAPFLRNGFYIFAIGLETGSVLLYKIQNAVVENLNLLFEGNLGHDLRVNRIAFRPRFGRAGENQKVNSVDQNILQLASCGADNVIKIYDLYWDNI